MKLRNKKTGEIAEPFGISCVDGRTFVQFDDGKGTFKFEARSLAELNEEWEDSPEEPKRDYYYIDYNGTIKCFQYLDFDWQEEMKQIGNYFDTREEAKKAVEKLKGWKRLKDKGFRFKNDSLDICCHTINFKVDRQFDMTDETSRDLHLLFGGEG